MSAVTIELHTKEQSEEQLWHLKSIIPTLPEYQKARNLYSRGATYSHYKGTNTAKYLVVVAPRVD